MATIRSTFKAAIVRTVGDGRQAEVIHVDDFGRRVPTGERVLMPARILVDNAVGDAEYLQVTAGTFCLLMDHGTGWYLAQLEDDLGNWRGFTFDNGKVRPRHGPA